MTGQPLVLSLFPGIGLLDMAFEEEGFSVVRGPDLLWGGDIRRFHAPPGRFDGVIGGPPCQRFSGLGKVNIARWGEDSVMPDLIPEFSRIVEEARPAWFVMENVPLAPTPAAYGYYVHSHPWDNRWSGAEQRRRRRITFGSLDSRSFAMHAVALESATNRPTVLSSGQAGHGGPRASIARMAHDQGLDSSHFDNSPFTTTELRRAIANGVPLPMGRAIAKAVKRAMYPEMVGAA